MSCQSFRPILHPQRTSVDGVSCTESCTYLHFRVDPRVRSSARRRGVHTFNIVICSQLGGFVGRASGCPSTSKPSTSLGSLCRWTGLDICMESPDTSGCMAYVSMSRHTHHPRSPTMQQVITSPRSIDETPVSPSMWLALLFRQWWCNRRLRSLIPVPVYLEDQAGRAWSNTFSNKLTLVKVELIRHVDHVTTPTPLRNKQ